jgi:hypothetical protein
MTAAPACGTNAIPPQRQCAKQRSRFSVVGGIAFKCDTAVWIASHAASLSRN